jgi:hypothetical protein
MDALGAELASRKQELTAKYQSSGIPTPKLTTMDEASV